MNIAHFTPRLHPTAWSEDFQSRGVIAWTVVLTSICTLRSSSEPYILTSVYILESQLDHPYFSAPYLRSQSLSKPYSHGIAEPYATSARYPLRGHQRDEGRGKPLGSRMAWMDNDRCRRSTGRKSRRRAALRPLSIRATSSP